MPERKESFWTFFINRRAVSILLIITIIILGFNSMMSMPKDIQPQINIPMATVSTFLPGATPTDTESLITKPLETAVGSLSSIKTLSSTSGVGNSLLLIEFEAGVDLTKATQDLKDRVDRVKSELPTDATDPTVTRLETDSASAVSFSIIGKRSLSELTDIAKDLKDELEKISGVSEVKIVGDQSKIVEIKVDQTKASAYGLSLQNISDIVKFSGPNIPVGIISTDNINYSIRIDNKYQQIEELRNLPLFSLPDENHTIILLSDIADIHETYIESEVKSELSVQGKEAGETVTLQIYKKKDGNVLQVVDDAKAKIDELKNTLIPEDTNIAVSNDNSVFIRTDLGILTSSGIQTTILIIFILFLALGFKEGLIAGLSIPVSLLFAMIFMELAGMTINSLTLFALVIALGLMVDTAIVIMEGIHLNIKNGLDSKEAAMQAVERYKWPLIAGTFTTIFAFFPMLLVSGLVGEFLKALPITISAALFGSLFLALTVGPSITAKILRNYKVKEKGSILEPAFNWLGEKFHNIIYFIVGKTSGKIITLVTTLILFLGSLSLPVTGLLTVEMFPQTDIQLFIINIETPKGSDLNKTQKVVDEVEDILYKIPEIENFLAIIGSSQGQVQTDIVSVSGNAEPNLANITANLVPKNQRDRKSYEIAEEVRQAISTINSGKVEIQELKEGPPGDAAITVRLKGESLETLNTIANDIKEIVNSTPGTNNVQTSLKQGINEIKFTLNRNKVAYYGLNMSQVGGLVRSSIQGIKSTTVNFNNEDLDVLVRYDMPRNGAKANISASQIKDLEIQTPKGFNVTLGQLGNDELTASLASIEREEQKRIVKVTADIIAGADLAGITATIEEKVAAYEIPTGYDLSFGGDKEAINESFRDLFQSMILAVVLIGFTLVLMFNSLKQPFIILLSLPLATIGVFPGLVAIGLKFSFPAFLGIVALAGVAVNDAIILIDRINQNRREGLEFKEAIAESSKSRLQPIIMTSITTIVGILPLALSNEFWQGLGFALIFGLAASTILTLFVIPVIYYLFEIRGEKRKLAEQLVEDI